MTVRSEEKNVLDAGANPAISTSRVEDSPRNLFYTEREWSRLVGYGKPPDAHHLCNNVRDGYPMGMNSFDRASSTQADSPKDD
jgi:hypothetical protein